MAEYFAKKVSAKFNKEISPRLAKDLGYTNIMEVPRITKVVINS